MPAHRVSKSDSTIRNRSGKNTKSATGDLGPNNGFPSNTNTCKRFRFICGEYRNCGGYNRSTTERKKTKIINKTRNVVENPYNFFEYFEYTFNRTTILIPFILRKY